MQEGDWPTHQFDGNSWPRRREVSEPLEIGQHSAHLAQSPWSTNGGNVCLLEVHSDHGVEPGLAVQQTNDLAKGGLPPLFRACPVMVASKASATDNDQLIRAESAGKTRRLI